MTIERILRFANLVVWLTLLSPAESLPNKGFIKVHVEVPQDAEIGSSLDLRCIWTLKEEDTLYSVKWYKDEHEFFRYTPGHIPMIQTFKQPGVYLDERANTANSIRLTKLTLGTSGEYKCEVSTEAPSFATTYRTSNLTVIVPPERLPDITGLSTQYAIGENVTANCTTWPSQPRATISWAINDELIPPEQTISYRNQMPASFEGSRSILGLRLIAASRYFDPDDGRATVKCIAKVGRRRYETESYIFMAHINNQPLSAGDSLRGQAPSHFIQRTYLLLIAATISRLVSSYLTNFGT